MNYCLVVSQITTQSLFYLSAYIRRQLHFLGYPVDLGVVVDSSLGHDIGKYGVLREDHHKVPYYHYYYRGKSFYME